MGIFNLHVFPDAHPKARKSQVDFDIIDDNADDDVHKERFPHYYYNENIPLKEGMTARIRGDRG